MPPTRPLFITPSKIEVFGFPAAGDDALRWSERLRRAHRETGLWPLLMDDEAPEYLTDSYADATVTWSPADADQIDGAAVLAERGVRSLSSGSPEYAAVLRAELAGQGAWPAEPERRGFGLPYGWNDEPNEVTVALVPAAEPWLVPVTLQYGSWNDYPDPAEHAAIMRYWHGRYGAEPVVWTGTTVEYAVARPPSTRADAIALAWEYRQYNDGEYDNYYADSLTDLAASLLNAPVWRMWWD